MATKRNRPVDNSNQSSESTDRGRKRLTNSSRELNRNEEQTSPSGRNKASDQWKQRSVELDRSTGRQTPETERPETSQWNQGSKNMTTGSDRPGAEIGERPNAESWNQTSREQYPTHSKSSPHMQENDEKSQSDMQEKSDRRMHTGNSERTGQQYSSTGNSSQVMDKNLRSGHPTNDREISRDRGENRKANSNNQGKDQRQADAGMRQHRQNKMNPDDDQVLEE